MQRMAFRLGRPAALLCPLLAASCAVFAPEARDLAAWEQVPPSFSVASMGGAADGAWWESFGSAELNDLVSEALRSNLTLAQARARLEQARATSISQGAARWPDVRVEGGAAAARQRSTADRESTVTRENYALGLASGYEVDLWGRVRSVAEAAALQRDATEADLHAAAISVSAEVVLRWVALVGQRQKIDLIRQQIEANEKVLELTELRFRQSSATAVDVLQQREAVARTRALLPLEEAREQTLLHDLAVLLGRAPASPVAGLARDLPEPPPVPDAGLPSALLARRPDLRAAEMRLSSADWQVSAARADRLPAIRLSGAAQYSDEAVSTLFDEWFGSLAASLTGPVFDAGRRRAEVRRARAAAEEALAVYRAAVLRAFREVEDALVQERKQVEYVEALSAQREAARQSYEEAMERYRKGAADFLRVLTAESNLQTVDRSLVQARVDRLGFRVALLRALGGSWPADLWNDEGVKP